MAQFWLKPKGTFDETLHCRVNGRRVYWRSAMPLPGGIAFENFELRETFQPGREIWFGYTTKDPAALFGFPYDVSPGASALRTLTDAEAAQIAQASAGHRALTNGDFHAGLDGWQLEGGAASFAVFPQGERMAVCTFGAHRDADQGRMYQCFEVPAEACELRFFLQGGCDRDRVYVALWDGTRLWRRMTGRNSNTPFEVRWNVEALRGKVVTLEICDFSDRPWGFIGAQAFELHGKEDRPAGRSSESEHARH